jgi:methylated-DNA-[protein]-cysteine S-methyltransferase
MFKGFYQSPVGTLEIVSDHESILEINFVRNAFKQHPTQLGKYATPIIKQCITELREYFEGKRQHFDVPINPQGTDFQKSVWNELLRIPYGTTTSYLNIAKSIGDVNAIRAVGTANGKNPIAIIIPCHRVIGNNGSLVGYSGGMENKKWLLLHEQEHSDSSIRNSLF